MDINKEVTRLREQQRIQRIQQAAAQREQAAQLAARQRVQAEQQRERAANARRVSELARRFIYWTKQSGIRPQTVAIKPEEILGIRYRKSISGWDLETTFRTPDYGPAPSPSEVGSMWYSRLVILSTSEVGWIACKISSGLVAQYRRAAPNLYSPLEPVESDYVEARIAEFIANSGSRVPWPNY